MRVCRGLALSLVALFAGAAPAQPVFFDDFDGDDLLPHWSTPPDWHWEYEVSGGMLHVTDLLYPSDDHFGGNEALLAAVYDQQTDFRADVRMGWDTGDDPQELVIRLKGPQGKIIATFGYSTLVSAPDHVIFASTNSGGVIEPAPPPGIYQFTVVRSGAEFEFYFDDEPFASFTDPFGTPAAGLDLWFVGPYPGELGAFHIDRVHVVPAPGVLSLIAAIGLCCPRHRRR
ncbi:MAG: hypothetical protein AMXMBFR77_03970 [Phycisphaerales bacterium]|nr:hypothetical protein [Phycisphaerales bacterium]GIK19166.1 MAG: hypothetical protein BroJett004_13300 [Planctomycetota bacterium]